jgi:D-alanyl-D-alanine carboxypeptidase/D-alanyl-D-alanine-endopeptidase (penicillin-binding protein 4)
MNRLNTCKRLAKRFLLSAICFPLFASAATADPTQLDATLQTLIQHKLPTAQWGMVVAEASTGKVLYEHNAAQLFLPASVTKLFTATAALQYLSSDYRYVTQITSTANAKHDDVITGNLYFDFNGDPTLSAQDINNMIGNLASAGVHTIHGNLVIDDSVFPQPFYALGITLDNLPYCYGAAAQALMIDSNCVNISLTQNADSNSITASSSSPWVSVSNHITWLDPQKPATCVFHPVLRANNAIELNGCLPKQDHWQFAMAVPNPTLLAKQLIQQALNTNHISLDGQIMFGKTPNAANAVLIQHSSTPLAQILTTVLKDSNNVYAASITKTLGYAYYRSGTNKAGVSAIQSIIANSAHINSTDYVLEDGAGLSRYNLISPQQISSLLYTIYNSPNLAEVLIPALPIAGQDGTLAHRLQNSALNGKVFAKTGTLNGVSNIAGYLITANNQTLIVVMMINDIGDASSSHARAVQDAALTTLLQYFNTKNSS